MRPVISECAGPTFAQFSGLVDISAQMITDIQGTLL